MEENRLAVIGLGLMGSRMSRRLLGDSFRLRGFDVDPRRMAEFEDAGGEPSGSPAEAVQGCWGAVLSLPDSSISMEVCLGRDGLSTSGASPLMVYDATTGWPSDAVEIADALTRVGITYCDSTVSGNGEIAERGELVVMVGG
ncbi:MAG TPA: NAD(P)-binding domain-containing protein, partial [Acidimicrobiia bacterium]